MPDMKGRFTDKELAFMDAVVELGDPVAAAKKAGYRYPAQAAQQLAQRDQVVEELARREMEFIHLELLPAVNRRMKRIINDDRVSPGAHISAAKLVYNEVYGRRGDGTGAKELHEMSMDEIQLQLAVLTRQQEAIIGAAVDVTPEDPESGAFG